MYRTVSFINSLIVFSLFFSFQIVAQEAPAPPIEWGEIPRADLEMKNFPADTNASAVILCDYGISTMNDDMNFVFERHLRVKILNQKGFSWGTHSIELYTDRKNGETIDDIEGVTYTLNANEKIEEKEFDDDELFEEKLSDKYTRYKFTLPGLQPGCIIEIRYKITAKSFFLVKDWVFQHSEPVVWSEYRFQHPVNLGFTFLKKGYERFAIEENLDVMQYFSGQASSYLETNLAKCALSRFVVKNAPALRDEQYITTLDDYYNKLEVQFSGYAVQGAMAVEKVLQTWDKFVEELLDNPSLGKGITITSDVEDLTNKITSGLQTPKEKIRAIYKWINSSIVWSGIRTAFAGQSVDDVIESKKGSSGDITCLLISMLRSAGIQSDPVILSTRDNGRVQDLYPMLSQFNYVIARAKIGTNIVFLDATNSSRPLELLPARVLGVRALVIQPNTVEWVTLQSPAKSSYNTLAAISIDENGGVTGSIEGLYKDYANVNIREDLSDKKEQDIAKDYFETETSGLTIDSVLITGKDTVDQPLKMKAWISSATYAQTGNDLLYLNPHIVRGITDNPFKSSSRKFPIDYNYPRETISIVNINVPESYEVKEGLRDADLIVSGSVHYRRQMVVDSMYIQVITKFEILNKEVPASQYHNLKELYARVIAMESEQLVVQKKPKPEPASFIEEPKPAPIKSVKKPAKKK